MSFLFVLWLQLILQGWKWWVSAILSVPLYGEQAPLVSASNVLGTVQCAPAIPGHADGAPSRMQAGTPAGKYVSQVGYFRVEWHVVQF